MASGASSLEKSIVVVFVTEGEACVLSLFIRCKPLSAVQLNKKDERHE